MKTLSFPSAVALFFLFCTCFWNAGFGQTAYFLPVTGYQNINPGHNKSISVVDLQTYTIRTKISPSVIDNNPLDFILSPSEDTLIVLGPKSEGPNFYRANFRYKSFQLLFYSTSDHSLITSIDLPENKRFYRLHEGQGPDKVLLEFEENNKFYLQEYDINTQLLVGPKIPKALPGGSFVHDHTRGRFFFLYNAGPGLPGVSFYDYLQGSNPVSNRLLNYISDYGYLSSRGDKFGFPLYLDNNQILVPDLVEEAGTPTFKLFTLNLEDLPPPPPPPFTPYIPTEKCSFPLTVNSDNSMSCWFSANADFSRGLLSAYQPIPNDPFSYKLTTHHLDLSTGTSLGSIQDLHPPFYFHPTNPNLAYSYGRGTLLPFTLDTYKPLYGKEIAFGQSYAYKRSAANFNKLAITSTAKLPKIQKASFPDIGYVLTRSINDRGIYPPEADESGDLVMFNQHSLDIQQKTPLDIRPEGAAFNLRHGNIYVFHSGSQTIKILDAATGVEKNTIQLPFTFENQFRPTSLIGVNESGNWIYLRHQYKDKNRPDQNRSILYALEIDTISLQLAAGTSPNPIAYELDDSDRIYFNPNGSKLCLYEPNYGTETFKVKIYDIAGSYPFNQTPLPTPVEVDGAVTRPSFNDPQLLMDYYGKTLYILDTKGIAIYDSATGIQNKRRNLLGFGYTPSFISPDGKRIYCTVHKSTLSSTIAGLLSIDINLLEASVTNTSFNLKSKYDHLKFSSNGRYVCLYTKEIGPHYPDKIFNVHTYHGFQCFDLQRMEKERHLYETNQRTPPEPIFVHPGRKVRDVFFPTFPPDQVAPAGGTAYIANTNDHTISVLDVINNEEILRIPLATDSRPYSIAVSPDGTRAYIGNEGNQKIDILQTASNELSDSPIVTGAEKIRAVAVHPDGTQLYAITDHDSDAFKGYLKAFDIANNHAAATPIELVLKPNWITIGNNDTIYITGRTLASVGALSIIPADASTAPPVIDLGGVAAGLVLSANQDTVYVGKKNGTTGAIVKVDAEDGSIYPDQFSLAQTPAGLAISRDGKTLYAAIPSLNRVSIFDLTAAATQTPVDVALPAGAQPEGLSLSPDGTQLLIVNEGTDNVSVLNTVDNTLLTTPIPVGDEPKGHSHLLVPYIPSVAVSVDDIEAYVPVRQQSGEKVVAIAEVDESSLGAQIQTSAGPFKILTSSNGEAVYLADQTGTSIQYISTLTKRSKVFELGFTPTGMALSQDQATLYVSGSPDGAIQLLDGKSGGNFGTLSHNERMDSIAISRDGQQLYGPAADKGLLKINTQYPFVPKTYYPNSKVDRVVFHPAQDIAFVQVRTGGLDSIRVFDISTETDAGWYITGGLENMSWFELSPDGSKLYYTDSATKKLYEVTLTYGSNMVLNATSRVEKAAFNQAPICLQLHPDGSKVYVLLAVRKLVVVDISGGAATTTDIDLKANPIGTGSFVRFP